MSAPTTWIYAQLGVIAKVSMGQSPDSSTYNDAKHGLPFFQGKAEFGKRSPTARKWCTSPSKVAEPGDILLSIRAPVGPINIADVRCAIGRGLAAITPLEGVDGDYLVHALRHLEPQLASKATGTTFTAVGGDVVRGLEVPLAPGREQKRIADKLDTVLTRMDTVNTRLARVAPLLKRFRQSVLAAATSGRLTEDWRHLAKVGLDSWSRFPVSEMSEVVDPHPSHRTPPEVSGGVPYISIGDITASGGICLENARRVSTSVLSEHNQRYKISKGDFIFGKIGTLGKPAKLPVNFDYTISANVLLIQPKQRVVIPDFAFLLFSSPDFMQSVIEQSAATSQAAFGIKKMRGTEVGLPSIEEQTEIVRRVETLFAFAVRFEARLQAAQTAADRLTPSLLAKAFRGELVPQDPNDEPASELLKRLAATSAQKPATKRGRKRSA